MKFGLIGHPIAHSLSPALFKAGYDGRYPYDLIESADFEEAYARFLKDYDGINVTAPFKELAVRKADILSEECRRIGATNLLIKTPEGIKAYNSDYLGVRQWLCEVAAGLKRTPPTSWAPTNPAAAGCSLQKSTGLFAKSLPTPAARGVARFSNPQPPHTATVLNNQALQRRDTRVSKMFEEHRSSDGARHCEAMAACPSGLSRSDWGSNIRPTILIVGLGGAGKAAAEASKSLGFNTILMNRTVFSEEIRPLEEFCRCFREADIVIYNIPTAIPQLADLTDDDFRGVTADKKCTHEILEQTEECRPKVILEANYKNPSFDKTLTDKMIAANPEAGYVSGETWLLYQALTGYELFTGEKPDLMKMSAVI